MGIRSRTIASITTAALVAVTAALTTAGPADAAAVKTVRVRMGANAIGFIGGGASTANGVTTLHAGTYRFHVVSRSGGHLFELLVLRNGYTVEQAKKDFNDAFSGNVPAVQRLDNGLTFRGGADASPGHPGDMVVTLKPGQMVAADLNGEATAQVSVVGQPRNAEKVAHSGTYTAFTFGWGVSKNLPASGLVKVKNQADQPHFLVLQHVKDSTTNKKVRKFIQSGAQGNPPWVLKGSADTGVLSPGKSQLFRYDLKPGKYLVACFWPDYFTGMPHVNMGMWKLVTLGG